MIEKENAVWDHYLKYLMEATQQKESVFKPLLAQMKHCVAADCSRKELRDMMVHIFEPGTVMQGLEQWQCMMDLLLFTSMDKFDGQSRYDHFDDETPPYADLSHEGRDNRFPNTHIYDLSGITQDMLHVLFNFGVMEADKPKVMEAVIRELKLQRNAEVQMLLGDLYQKVGLFEEGIRVFKNIRLNRLADDRSIDDAIRFTDYLIDFQRNGTIPPGML